MAITRYKRFQKAVVDYFCACSPLVTFSGHTSNDPKIFKRDENAEVELPCVTITFTHNGSMMEDIDGMYESIVQIDAWAEDDISVMDALGEIEKHVSQTAGTQTDAKIESDGIRTLVIVPLAPLRCGVPSDNEESGVYVSTMQVRMRWIDTGEPTS